MNVSVLTNYFNFSNSKKLIPDMSRIFGRNEGAIISLKTMVNEGSINKNDLNDDIYNKVYSN